MPKDLPVIACTLPAGEQPERARAIADLLSSSIDRERIDDGVAFWLPIALEKRARTLIAQETECCPFFDFTFVADGGCVRLEVRAPSEAAAIIDRLFAR